MNSWEQLIRAANNAWLRANGLPELKASGQARDSETTSAHSLERTDASPPLAPIDLRGTEYWLSLPVEERLRLMTSARDSLQARLNEVTARMDAANDRSNAPVQIGSPLYERLRKPDQHDFRDAGNALEKVHPDPLHWSRWAERDEFDWREP